MLRKLILVSFFPVFLAAPQVVFAGDSPVVAAIDQIAGEIANLKDAGILKKGQAKSLTKSLESAAKALEGHKNKGHKKENHRNSKYSKNTTRERKAGKKLEKFIKQINKLVKKDKLPTAFGRDLVAAARAVIEQIRGSGEAPPPTDGTTIIGQVDADVDINHSTGGTIDFTPVSTPDAQPAEIKVELAIAPGALSQDTTITIENTVELQEVQEAEVREENAGAVLLKETVFDYGPDGLQFSQPVPLTIGYDPNLLEDGIDESTLVLHKLVAGQWTPVPGSTVDTASHEVTGEITSFSIYAVLSLLNVILETIDVTPTAAKISAGSTLQYIAVGTYNDTSTLDLTGSVTWTSSDPLIATVSSTGVVTGVGAGTVTITGASGAISGSNTLEVTAAVLVTIDVTPSDQAIPEGISLPFVAIGTYSDASTQDITKDVTWTSSDALVATVSTALWNRGTITGVSGGAATITATSNVDPLVSGSGNLTVNAITLDSIAVTPVTPSIALGTRQQFTATGTYSDASTLDITADVSWDSSDGTVATVNALTGSAQAVATGATTITATMNGGAPVSGSTELTVTGAVLQSLAIAPATVDIAVGSSTGLTATGTFSDASEQDLTGLAGWSSSNTAIATVSNQSGNEGVATGQGVGAATITATVGSFSGTAALTVNPHTVEFLVVNGSNAQPLAGVEAWVDNESVPRFITQADGKVTLVLPDLTNSVVFNAGGGFRSVGLLNRDWRNINSQRYVRIDRVRTFPDADLGTVNFTITGGEPGAGVLVRLYEPLAFGPRRTGTFDGNGEYSSSFNVLPGTYNLWAANPDTTAPANEAFFGLETGIIVNSFQTTIAGPVPIVPGGKEFFVTVTGESFPEASLNVFYYHHLDPRFTTELGQIGRRLPIGTDAIVDEPVTIPENDVNLPATRTRAVFLVAAVNPIGSNFQQLFTFKSWDTQADFAVQPSALTVPWADFRMTNSAPAHDATSVDLLPTFTHSFDADPATLTFVQVRIQKFGDRGDGVFEFAGEHIQLRDFSKSGVIQLPTPFQLEPNTFYRFRVRARRSGSSLFVDSLQRNVCFSTGPIKPSEAGVCAADAIPLTVGTPIADTIPELGRKFYTFNAAANTAHHVFVTPTAVGRANADISNSAGTFITGVPIGDARSFLLFAPATPFARDIYTRVQQRETDEPGAYVGQTDFSLEVQTTGDGTTPATAIDWQQIFHSEPAFGDIPVIRLGALSLNENRYYVFDAEETRGYFISMHSFAPAPVDWLLFTNPGDPAGSTVAVCTSEFVNEFGIYAADCGADLTANATYYLGVEQKGYLPPGRTTTNYDLYRQ